MSIPGRAASALLEPRLGSDPQQLSPLCHPDASPDGVPGYNQHYNSHDIVTFPKCHRLLG